jgi:hypothetical protein
MAQKTMLVTLEVTVADLTREQRREAAQDGGCKVSELPRLVDTSPGELAEMIETVCGDPELQVEMFAGTDTFVRFTGAKVKSAAWL